MTMIPRNQNLLATLNILALVSRVKKQMYPNPSDKRGYILQITKEHLAQAEITPPVFINTLHDLVKKGYAFVANSAFESKSHADILKVLGDTEYKKIQSRLAKTDTSELEEGLKSIAADMLEKAAPADIQIDREDVMQESVSMATLMDGFREAYEGYTPDVVSVIILSPFRRIERLLEQVNAGVPFDDVKDEGIWYDAAAYEFHFDDTTVSTAYQGKPNKEHFALAALFSQSDEPRLDYIDIPKFDNDNKGKDRKAYLDALNRFIKKHSRLAEIFSVHFDHLAINEPYIEHPH